MLLLDQLAKHKKFLNKMCFVSFFNYHLVYLVFTAGQIYFRQAGIHIQCKSSGSKNAIIIIQQDIARSSIMFIKLLLLLTIIKIRAKLHCVVTFKHPSGSPWSLILFRIDPRYNVETTNSFHLFQDKYLCLIFTDLNLLLTNSVNPCFNFISKPDLAA
jgi:hypothetical protein